MTSIRANAAAVAEADQVPWYDLIDEIPEPLEDGMQQDDTILRILSIIWAMYADDPYTLVVGQATQLVYDSARPGSFLSPDGYVIFGVPARMIKRDRRIYRIDEWGPPPAFVMEVASDSTASRDMREKREIYARMGAGEYWRFDPSGGERYGEPLIGERLVDGEYERFETRVEANGDVWARSVALGVDFYWRIGEDGHGEFFVRDSEAGEWLGDLSEERAARAEAEVARLAAEAERDAAEARARALEAELERLRGSGGE